VIRLVICSGWIKYGREEESNGRGSLYVVTSTLERNAACVLPVCDGRGEMGEWLMRAVHVTSSSVGQPRAVLHSRSCACHRSRPPYSNSTHTRRRRVVCRLSASARSMPILSLRQAGNQIEVGLERSKHPGVRPTVRNRRHPESEIRLLHLTAVWRALFARLYNTQ
jgi:hypothetical protein